MANNKPKPIVPKGSPRDLAARLRYAPKPVVKPPKPSYSKEELELLKETSDAPVWQRRRVMKKGTK